MTDVERVRDLLILDAPGRLVVACDSVGGIGPKPADTVPATARTTAHFATRVPLLEVLCAGARPIAVVDTLCVERAGLGEELIAEVRSLAGEAGVPAEAVTGSTEDNVPTRATGIGVTVLGLLPPGRRVGGTAWAGDVVLCAGLPLSAPRDHLFPGHPGQVPLDAVRRALASGLVHEALPVGSRGVAHEVNQLAANAGLVAAEVPSGVSPTDSGGPSSCVLFACAAADADALADVLGAGVPLAAVARLTTGG